MKYPLKVTVSIKESDDKHVYHFSGKGTPRGIVEILMTAIQSVLDRFFTPYNETK